MSTAGRCGRCSSAHRGSTRRGTTSRSSRRSTATRWPRARASSTSSPSTPSSRATRACTRRSCAGSAPGYLWRAMRRRIETARRAELEHEVQEAWEALRYWQDRHDGLSPLRRAARREARERAEAWKARLREAERAAYGPPAWEPLAVALRAHRFPERVARFRRRARRAALAGVVAVAGLAGASAATAAVVIEKVLGG